MRRRLIPLDFVAMLLLVFAVRYHWAGDLSDFKGWAVRSTVTMLSIFAMSLHFVLNRGQLFSTGLRYGRLVVDLILFAISILWLMDLGMGLQGDALVASSSSNES